MTLHDKFVESSIDGLILLEQKTGAKVQYGIMPPFTAPFRDLLSVQEAAKRIAAFIGLVGYTFIVAEAKQVENVGGHIDLSTEGNDIFIEIDPAMIKFPDSVAATLCHEVCHKWLQHNNINFLLKIDNEILTDITCIFLGFGKIMLNGCKAESTRNETNENGTLTFTETMTTGYLNREQLAFLYCVVNTMRKIPPSKVMYGLTAEAAQAVEQCNLQHGHYYVSEYHQQGANSELASMFDAAIAQAQFVMVELNKYLQYITISFIDTIANFLKENYKKIESVRQDASQLMGENSDDPALNFLRIMKSSLKLDQINQQMKILSKDANVFKWFARKIALVLFRNKKHFPSPSPSMFNVVVCPKDGTRLKLPENSPNIIVTCPKCKYRFLYNTTMISFSENHIIQDYSVLKKIRSVFVRKQKS